MNEPVRTDATGTTTPDAPPGQAGSAARPRLKPWETPILWLATGFGFGYAPVASGTFGSLWGPPLVWGLTELMGHDALALDPRASHGPYRRPHLQPGCAIL